MPDEDIALTCEAGKVLSVLFTHMNSGSSSLASLLERLRELRCTEKP